MIKAIDQKIGQNCQVFQLINLFDLLGPVVGGIVGLKMPRHEMIAHLLL